MASLTQLQYVLAVDQHRHFARAARASFVSQPTLSMQLQKLEDELGVVIFDRTKKPIVPTDKGQEVINHAKRVMSEMKALEYVAKKSGTEPEGELSLGIIPTLAPYLLPLFLSEFSKQYPKVRLLIDEMKTEEIIDALEKDKIDAGLLVTPLGRSTIREKPLFYEPFSVFVSEDHPLFKKTRVSEDDLDPKSIWLLKEGHCLRSQAVRLCHGEKNQGVLPNVSFESGDLETLKQLVLRGNGYTLLPYLSFYREKSKELLKMIRPFTRPVPSREVSMVYRRDELKADILDVLSKTIIKQVPETLTKGPSQQIEIVEI